MRCDKEKTVRVAGAKASCHATNRGSVLQQATEGAVTMNIPVGTEPGTGSAKKAHQSGRQLALRDAIAFPLRPPFGPS